MGAVGGVMRTIFLFSAIWVMVLGSGGLCMGNRNAVTSGDIRQPVVAGRFYPDDAEKLSLAIEGFIKDAKKLSDIRPDVIISPHAGYIYSGQIAADAFNQARGHSYDVVIILGTNHTRAGFDGVSVFSGAGYRTPLGTVDIDQDIAGRLIGADQRFTYHPRLHEKEHSVEVQVPFVQMLFPKLKIVTAIVGKPDKALCSRFAEAILDAAKDRKPLFVASSDLSHYPGYDDACKVDHGTLDAVLSLNPDRLRQTTARQEGRGFSNLSTCACGQGPMMVAMALARQVGSECGKIVSYANSGDTAVGDRSRVVGYGAIAFYPKTACPDKKQDQKGDTSGTDESFSPAQKKELLAFARKSIHRFLTTQTAPLARPDDPRLLKKQGAFVTLKINGRLRGCIGHMAENMPLSQVVGAMALQAAFNDHRFRPLTISEFDDIHIEISVLTPFKKIKDVQQIQVGRDGVLIRKAGHQAVFLPQVAPEQGWNRDQMLQHLCTKAGLAPDDWKKGADFFTFQAIVFDESELGHN